MQHLATNQNAQLLIVGQSSQICSWCRRHFVLSNALAQLFMSRFVQKIFAIKSRSRKRFFGPKFLAGTTPTFLRQIVIAMYCPPSGKGWLSSGCWSPSVKPGNELKCGMYGGLVTMQVQFEAVCEPKFTTFWDNVGEWRPLFSTHLPHYAYRVSFRRYRPLKLPLSCEVVTKRCFLGHRFLGKGYTPHFRHAFSNCMYFQACGWFWWSSIQQAQRVGDQKEDRKKESQ